ncbi:MAG TPA: hypothetical protein VM287_04715 [Egibacteraceae bacterium]|jgi:hypothetical protein|nr:hypothetical protein [Egibacteraceae bacterium]
MPEEPNTDPVEPLAGDDTKNPSSPEQQPQAPSNPADASKPKTLEDLLGNLDDDQRRIVQAEVTKARNEAKSLRDRLKAAEPKAAEHDKAVAAQKTAEERAEERAAAAEKRAAEAVARAVRSEIRGRAADRFADPDDPAGFLDHAKYVNDTGEIDVAAIDADLAELLTRKPHLGKPDPQPRPPAPNRAQGSSGNGAAEPPVAPGMSRLRQAYANTSSRKK